MILTPHTLDEIRILLANGSRLPDSVDRIDGLSLGAALESAACWSAWTRDGRRDLADLVEHWADQLSSLGRGLATLADGADPGAPADPFAAPRVEWRRIAGPEDLTGTSFGLYLERFARSMEGHGFAKPLAKAISFAFGEMADNVVQHSASPAAACLPALAGYHVTDNQMAYGVADIGRGVLASLHDNPRWAHLDNSREALRAAVQEHASRRAYNGCGDGFRQALKSLASLSGHLRFRSCDGLLSIQGDRDGMRAVAGFAAPFDGLQLSVACSVSGTLAPMLL